ncbi:MAG: hypothetical protein F4164_05740 [Gemmatimonadales bacterium]|nr:hypothetical protein [Gemmatimonadales bacterium]MYG48872.1 hypothetical protein [Gemmatimonadales bacterium]MYK02858.1 hypothetical protein [Candidatus Palauibacter ramosifaciens]
MRKTILAVRLEEELREAVNRRAVAEGTTVSGFVRETLREAVADRPIGDRIRHLKGTVRLESADDAWRVSLRSRNWRR